MDNNNLLLDPNVTPLVLGCITLSLAGLAEWLHLRRVKRMSRLAFGPTASPAGWTILTPFLRTAACAALAWSFLTLYLYKPADGNGGIGKSNGDENFKHVILIIDVSPSMILARDAGEKQILSRRERMKELLDSMLDRMQFSQCRISLIAFHNTAQTILRDCQDLNVLDNLLDPKFPLLNCFSPGKTKLLDGVVKAFELAKDWKPNSTTLIFVTDGDTIPDEGIPDMPASISNVIIAGVGDVSRGQMIDDHHSRQDTATLKQLARRLKGSYFDCNKLHLPTESIRELTETKGSAAAISWDRRKIALVLIVFSSLILVAIPVLLCYYGTHWRKAGVAGGAS